MNIPESQQVEEAYHRLHYHPLTIGIKDRNLQLLCKVDETNISTRRIFMAIQIKKLMVKEGIQMSLLQPELRLEMPNNPESNKIIQNKGITQTMLDKIIIWV